ncbi:c-type cytochrome biogenesis protein CcmI [Szabonella alba]|uniref:C-type cytochrome biogenesis protein CcmI n=1 Tax=Szabonella alba TaxID=2804194 RepID=A0A8K0VC31_9RHOB|nr:c-type cytochrome biogenesis protein CcmI [Szabonella alba]MBL4919163.1 c-type cytochrome biogenesis protein CcmI [Szabonella alba]
MLFWAMAGAMTLGVAMILLQALRRGGEGLELRAAEFDGRVYRDQLREIEREVARGIVTEDEAGRMRAEVARRLLETDRVLSAAEAQTNTGTSTAGASRGAVMVGSLVLVTLLAGFWIYTRLGAPGTTDLPLQLRLELAEDRRAARLPQAALEAALPPSPPLAGVDPDFARLVEQLRATVEERPDDLQGHQLLARNEANLGNFDAAHRAQARVITLKGNAATAQDRLLHATLMIQAAAGQVSPEAENIIRAVLQGDPRNDTALFFAGLLNLQIGRQDLTFRFWRQLLDTAPPESPWRPEVRDRIEELARIAGVRYELPPETTTAQPALPGPAAADIEAAADLSPAERDEMIRGMVEGLNARLATEGGTADEWARLILALAQLGERERAEAIRAEALVNFAGREADLARIAEAASRAGLTE